MKTVEMIERIAGMLQPLGDELVKQKERDKGWTAAIHRALHILGDDAGFYVYTHKNDYDPTVNEWLYDQVWCQRDEKGVLQKVFMVMESEWKTAWSEVIYDFNKLLLARSDLRVFVFESRDVSEVMSQLRSIIQTNPLVLPGDVYLLCGWDYNKVFLFETVNRD